MSPSGLFRNDKKGPLWTYSNQKKGLSKCNALRYGIKKLLQGALRIGNKVSCPLRSLGALSRGRTEKALGRFFETAKYGPSNRPKGAPPGPLLADESGAIAPSPPRPVRPWPWHVLDMKGILSHSANLRTAVIPSCLLSYLSF